MKTVHKKRIRPNGDEYWVIETEAGQEIASSPCDGISEGGRSAATKKNTKKLDLCEPAERPLSEAEERVKRAALRLNLNEAEADLFARGRR